MMKGIDILVGTPGRILDHMNRGNLNLAVSHNSYFILELHIRHVFFAKLRSQLMCFLSVFIPCRAGRG